MKTKLYDRLLKAFIFLTSPEGRKDVGALIGVVTAIYVALHRAGATP